MPKLMRAVGAKAPRRVFIAIPAYAGNLTAECVISVTQGIKALAEVGIASDLNIETGNCHVDDARNSLVRVFLASDCDDFVFIDEDVGFRSADLVRLVTSPHEVAAGIYPKKQEEIDYPVVKTGERIAIDGWMEVEGAPTGFMKISRSCLESLKADATAYVGQDGNEYHTIFERTVLNGRRWSGDYAFCQKWRDKGGKIYIDPDMRFTHTGSKTWEGCVGDFWRKEAGLLGPKFYEGVERLKKGEATHEVFTQLFDGWGNPCAAFPDCLMAAYRLAKRGRVIETGSGLTTIVMAIAGAEVHALEANIEWHAKLTRTLDDCGLHACVYYTPMKDYGDFVWYEIPESLPMSFDVSVCDGPERTYGRSGLYRILGDRIKDADWLSDDCNDPAQLAMFDHYTGDRAVHVLGTDGQKKFAIALRQDHDRTASNQPSPSVNRETRAGAIPNCG